MLRSVTAGLVLAFAGSRANVARTILSCAGIIIGIGALITVVTVGDVGERYARSYSEAVAGRAATFQVDLTVQPENPEAFETDLRRAGGSAVSLDTWISGPLLRSAGTTIPDVSVNAVDASLSDIRRLEMVRGRWFAEEDQESLVPMLVANEALAELLGDGTDVQIGSRRWLDARVVGVVESSAFDSHPQAYLLRAPASAELLPAASSEDFFLLTYSVLVPPDDADPEAFLRRLEPVSWRWGLPTENLYEAVSVWRSDDAEAVQEVLDYLSLGLLGVASITLLTGLLGILNVGLVTVRERRRELATYRALGASSLTLFVAVVTEAVVVSVVAGAIALTLCLAGAWGADILVSPYLPSDVSIFVPPEAALVGLSGAAFVGLLAGVIPAWRALRASVVAGLRE
ncbi:ABC transporter permease [Thermobifida halotolerans]|uniref:ABC transporter permease n=1 Tax=Thermobifida halotolerans TaxID=483545 RepID=A0A399FZW0_9ACTN|nr:ABC transporter permease [Thermobifida halotolerans]UOE19619.1 ABC transporter permease [Thermobifida halotolerans]